MRIIQCDRCKERIVKAEDAGYISAYSKDSNGDLKDVIEIVPRTWDLCPACMEEIAKFVTCTKKKDEKAPKKPTKPSAPKKLDTGKIKALADAGRSVAWIADEMGCSEVAVRNHLKKMEEVEA